MSTLLSKIPIAWPHSRCLVRYKAILPSETDFEERGRGGGAQHENRNSRGISSVQQQRTVQEK